jgi:uncharacterized protein
MATNIARLPLQPSRPTVEIDGQRAAVLEAALVSYELTDSLESMARAELVFGNWGGADKPGFQHFDRKTVEFGKGIKVKKGDDILFEGRITAICAEFPEGSPPQIGIFAEDRLQDLRMTRRTRCFAQKSLGDVARSIANDHGLQAQVSATAPSVPLLAQLNQSDLAFLTEIARRFDADIYVAGKTLHVVPSRDHAVAKLAWAGTLRSFNVCADLAHQRTAVVASGWDVRAKAGVSHKAQKAAVSRELGQDEAGADILQRAFAARVDTIAHNLPTNASEARQIAEAGFRHMARTFVTGEGVCETDPKVRAGAKLELTGLGPLFDGTYRATAVSHLFDPEHGARSEFRCNRPGLGRPQ